MSSSNYKVFWECSRGHEWVAAIYSRTGDGRGCPYCAGQKPTAERNLEVIYPELAEQWSRRNELSPSEYMPSSNKVVWWACKNKHEWKTSLNSRVSGTGCPECAQSKGERKAMKWLEGRNINYKRQYEFLDLLSDKGNPLKFDFVTFSKKGDLKFLIEYDGEFHFSKQYLGDNFERTVYHDRLKNEYCEKRGIDLLRIPYYKSADIDTILAHHIYGDAKQMETGEAAAADFEF